MSLIQETIKAHVHGLRSSPKGWWTINCPMCVAFGQPRPDTKRRGGFRFDSDGSTAYHCFNCGFKVRWQPGQGMGHKLKTLLRQIGVDEGEVQRLNLQLMSERDDTQIVEYKAEEIWTPEWPTIEVPGSSTLTCEAAEYIEDRKMTGLADWHWCDAKFWNIDKRVILPYTWGGNTVGYAARWIGTPPKDTPKILRKAPTDFVFNMDPQGEPRKFVLVVEGEFDALAVDGVAVLHNDISAKQAQLIADLDVEPIVVPDRDRSGTKLAERAIELGWSVAFPDWDNGIKDCADAAKAYGRVVTLNSIVQSRQDNPLKIKIMLRKN